MCQSSNELFIRIFQKEDMPLLGDLYHSVISQENAVFWWVGDEDNWNNVYCAFENNKMIAKGQVNIINIVPPGQSQETKHSIYVNLKCIRERENDYGLLELIYERLVARAIQLKESLPTTHGTILCVGNDYLETANSRFFIERGYQHLNSLFRMVRDLNNSIPELGLHEGFLFSHWKMESFNEEREYLDIEAEIWPDTPLRVEKLSENKRNPLWTAMVIRQGDIIVASLMVWQEEDYGVIEDVFVREPWRNRGMAKYLLTQALNYLKLNELRYANLTVLTTNKSALALYESVGFYVEGEEIRYYIELN